MLKPYKTLTLPDEHKFIHAEKYAHYSDEEIIKKIQQGYTPLFEIIVRRYNQRLFRIQRSYISDEHAIKDTLQLTYIKTFENLESFRGEALFSTWITRIAIHEALKYLKREKRYSRLHVVSEGKPERDYQMTNEDEKNPENQTIQKELKHLLETTVNRLAPKYRAVYMMREIEEMSTRETAECLNISPANVKTRLHRAKQMIREDLERSVADTDIFNFRGSRCDLMVYRVMYTIMNQEIE